MDSTISMPYCIRCHSYRDNGFPLLCMKGLDEFPINLFTGSHKDQILLHYCFSAQRHYRLSANTLSQPWLNQVLPPIWFSGQFPIILAVSPPPDLSRNIYTSFFSFHHSSCSLGLHFINGLLFFKPARGRFRCSSKRKVDTRLQ